MRWDSPFVLVSAGTAAIHVILLVFVDAMIVTHPLEIKPPAPRIEMIEVKVDPPPVIKPAAAPIQKPTEPPPPVKEAPRVRTRTPEPEVPPPQPQPQPPQTDPQSGGDPVVAMPDIAPAATGVAVATGKRTTGHIGRGGSGGGTGSGSGAGNADPPPPPPVSIATIKTRALPRGDYGYIDAGRDYPAAARQLGIEGAIRVKLVVDARGKVSSAILLNKLGHGLDELALTRAQKIEFDPAKDTDDKPVSSVVIWTFNMTLPK